ncbi:hypothetical protein [Lactobacillus intestinalis]|uniref:Uncharacterized protein n=1 Tax=Lactobacillus intestinalis TaxID=151781 RepID=A0A4S2BND5_9LACO|nr:hypothetical protein [Lactobacillus intestinalis]KAI4315911.1 hypothetical protein C821_000306 [Lactobacillus intestinalis]TGY16549.1 hypothetical protein E5351_03010 [Lactobacillus intestinalis]
MIPVLIGGIIGFALTESDGLLKKVSWKVWMILIFATVGFALLLPLLGLQRIRQEVIIVSQIIMIIFINILLENKINKILAFVIALLAGTIWAILLVSVGGVIYGE